MPRADFLTALDDEPIIYSDIPMNLDLNPVTGLLARVTNEDAVKMALRNLILTSMGESLYEPFFGSKVKSALHGPANAMTADIIKTTIKNAIDANEPRVEQVDINVSLSSDGYTFIVKIYYKVINIQETQTLEVTLKRIR
jgi:phage baseplate assembly protein W